LLNRHGIAQQAQAARPGQAGVQAGQANFGAAVIGDPAMRPGHGIAIDQSGTGRALLPVERQPAVTAE
jgi:hypothetical protein